MSDPLGSQGIGDQETEILLSRLEKAQIDIINEFDNISKNNGFRNDVAQAIGAVRPSALIQSFPEIGVVIPKGSLSFGTGQTSDQSFDELATVYVVGTFEAETATNSDSPEFQLATESLIQDFAAVWANITTKYINAEEHWSIASLGCTITPSVDFGDKPNRGTVELSFQISLNAQDPTFT